MASRREHQVLRELQKAHIAGIRSILEVRDKDQVLYHEFMLGIPQEDETQKKRGKRGRKKRVDDTPADDEERDERRRDQEEAFRWRKEGYTEMKFKTNMAIRNAPSSKRKEELRIAGERRADLRPRNYKHKRTKRIVTEANGEPCVERIDADVASAMPGDGPRERREREGMQTTVVPMEHCPCAEECNQGFNDPALRGMIRNRNDEMCMPVGCEIVCKRRRTDDYWKRKREIEEDDELGRRVRARKVATAPRTQASGFEQLFAGQLRGGTRPRTDDGQPGTWHRVVAARGDPATEEQDTHT